ncbi:MULTISPECIES: SHOCT domain-containing protein [unclassified Gemella]|uniref:SHOCT domain-containing protein n=1 Tax=unclassified Gemella TaxID=2624949 RepID=UPI001C04B95C|nr:MULTISPECIES: SHOCT domain-containing protein [unclassified Gemella]MBU0279374.1 hypothetical protein [Gemella sp. zg-1178]QWQ39163.1 hypothetical protein KMP11_02200 [Gemella sp. zg-570]
MNDNEFNKELLYQITIIYLKKLLKERTITKEDYNIFKNKMIEEYNPILSKYTEEILDK